MRALRIVGWNVRRVRVARGVSQERLAFDAGVDRSYVGGLERGEMNPSVDVLERLAATLGVAVFELLVEPAEGESAPRPAGQGAVKRIINPQVWRLSCADPRAFMFRPLFVHAFQPRSAPRVGRAFPRPGAATAATGERALVPHCTR